MRKVGSIILVLLVVGAFVALAYMRSSEFRTEDTSIIDDIASFSVTLLVLAGIAVLLDFAGDSFLKGLRDRKRLTVVDAELNAEESAIRSAREEIAVRQNAPIEWESQAKMLASAYDGEYEAEVTRQSSAPVRPGNVLGSDRRTSREH